MLKSSFCDCSDAYKLVKGTITVRIQAGDNPNYVCKEVVFKSCVPFTDCISEINNSQIDNAKDIDAVMPMYNLIEHSDNYSRASESLWKYYKDEPSFTDVGAIANFDAANNSSFFNVNKK